MLTIRTYVAPSKIHGLGVFADEAIEAGACVWTFNPVIDVEIDFSQPLELPPPIAEIVGNRSFIAKDGKAILSRDNGVFLNHSYNPNTLTTDFGLFAARDISVGDEITENYLRSPSCPAAEFLLDEECEAGVLHPEAPRGAT